MASNSRSLTLTVSLQEELLKAKDGLKLQYEELEKLTPLLKEAVAEERRSASETARAERDLQDEVPAAPPAQSEEEPLLKTDTADGAAAASGTSGTISGQELLHFLQLIYFAQASQPDNPQITVEHPMG